MGTICPFLIMSFYTVLGGYAMKYMVANFGDIFGAGFGVGGADSGAYFGEFLTKQGEGIVYTFLFCLVTWVIVRGGVSKGIEAFSKVAMPALFILLLIVIVRGLTLPGAMEGVAFMFKPSFEVFEGTGWITVLGRAGGQMFFSLSLGMGCMITYGSYLNKKENIEQNAVIIPVLDTTVALLAGLAVMPTVFAMGMEPGGGPGLLFVTLQAVFASMGGVGPIFGFLFYLFVVIAAVTSAVSLLEVATATFIDKEIAKGNEPNRHRATLICIVIIFALAVIVALDGLGSNGLPMPLGFIWLDFFDLFSEGIMMPLGALSMSLIIGWKLGPKWMEDEITASGDKWKGKAFAMVCFKYIAPLGMLFILVGQLNGFFGWGLF
jgi:NSS family neurotransmitter:Na+ symporter